MAHRIRDQFPALNVHVDNEKGSSVAGVMVEAPRHADLLVMGGTAFLRRARIGDLPSGHGLLGELIRHPEALRLGELSEHPDSAGFPEHHPPMSTFTRALLSGASELQVLEGTLERAREITGAEMRVFYLVGAGGELRGSLALGEGTEAHRGIVLPSSEGTLAAVAARAEDGMVTVADVAADDRVTVQYERWKGFGPAVAVAVGTGEKLSGVLMPARRSGRLPCR